MADTFPGKDNLLNPALKMFAVVPSDVAEIDPLPKALRCNVGGTVALQTAGSASDVSITMIAGETLYIRAKYVRATGTTASLHALA